MYIYIHILILTALTKLLIRNSLNNLYEKTSLVFNKPTLSFSFCLKCKM